MRQAGLLQLASLTLAAGGFCMAGSRGFSHADAVTGAGLLGCAAAAAMVRSASLRRAVDRLTMAASDGDVVQLAGNLRGHGGETQPLADALRQTARRSGERVVEAESRAKELEIQLKVTAAERQQAQAIIHGITDAVLVTDRFDEIVLANDAAARLLGFDLITAKRKAVDAVLTDTTITALIREMRQSRITNGRRVVEHNLKDGEQQKATKITLACVADASGDVSGVVTVLHDMTREREIARMKNDFVSHVSHELRTPLASIRAYVEMLIDGEAEDEKTRTNFYEIIQTESNRLGRLIDNILNISRIESGLVKINRQPTSLMVILKQAIEVVTPQARLKQIAIEEQLEPAFCQTLGDRDMLYQAVMNLLGNAIKYTPENGKITLASISDEVTRTVTVKITDTGVGIPAKALPFVFDKFYRVEENNHMGKGTGLGLSLVKHIVETVHGGQVFVESQVGVGSTFGFTVELSK